MQSRTMIRIVKHPVLTYGVALALLAIALQSLQYFYWIRKIPTEFYIVILAIVFTVLGVWMGRKISRKKLNNNFVLNIKAIQSLGISPRELEVLQQMSKGMSNEEIADKLHISLSTVKTHVSNLLLKLNVDNRVKAINKAQRLQIIKN